MDWTDIESEDMNVLEISVGMSQDAADHALPVVVMTINDKVVELDDIEMVAAIAMNLLEASAFVKTVMDEVPDHLPETIAAAMTQVQARLGRKMN